MCERRNDMKKNNKANIDWSQRIINIRAVAILLVVTGHSIIIYSNVWELYSTANNVWLLDEIKRMIDIVSMPIYFSVSGYLFTFTHKKKRGLMALIKNKAKRLLIPYIAVGFVYMFPIKWLVGYSGYKGKDIFEVIQMFLEGEDVGHLWFLPALFLMFIICEIFIEILEKIGCSTRCASVVMFLGAVVVYFEGYRMGGYGPLLSAFTYMIWFTFGYLTCVYLDMIQYFYQYRVVKMIGVIVAASFLFYCIYENTSVTLQLTCKALWIWNLYMLIPDKKVKIINMISQNSYGIYLFHSPLIYITFTLIPNACPAVVVLVNFGIFGYMALFLTMQIKKTRMKFLLGE